MISIAATPIVEPEGSRFSRVFRSLVLPLTVLALIAAPAHPQAIGITGTPSPTPSRPSVPDPQSVLGFRIGEDGRLASWDQIVDYMQRLSAASPRVRVEEIGRSALGRPMIQVVITSAENQGRLEEIRLNQERIADPRGLTGAERDGLIRGQPAVVFIGASLHGNEIMGTQMAVELAYELATDADHAALLQDVVVLLVPSMNPDGLEIVREWFFRTRGTPHADAPLPRLYHHYVGHDNNRDFFMITQPETRAVSDVLYRRWFPLLVWDIHEMNNGGERFFLPPFADPLNPNLDPLLVRLTNLVGVQMAADMTAAGLTGITHGRRFDLWWHGGGRTVPARHNMIGILSEVARASYADPVHQPASSLRQPPHGSLYPEPWAGGWWRASDIVEYELVAARSLLRLLARQRDRFVRDKIELGRRQVALGEAGFPYAYLVPPGQRDEAAAAEMLQVLRRGAVEVHEAVAGFSADGREYPAGTRLVLMAQPYRAHAKDLLEYQSYPDSNDALATASAVPYDLAGWTLPLQMGVDAHPVAEPFELPPLVMMDSIPVRPGTAHGRGRHLALDPSTAHSHRAAFEVLGAGGSVRVARDPIRHAGGSLPSGSLIVGDLPDLGPRAARWAADWGVTSHPVTRPTGPARRLLRVGLYQPWTASRDEGWTRWIFEQWGVPFESLRNPSLRSGGLRDRFDTIVIPSVTYAELMSGLSGAHPEYAGGLGAAGIAALRVFVEAGGTLVLLGDASVLGPRQLGVGVRDVTEVGGAGENWHAPGSLLRVEWNPESRVSAGLPREGAVFYHRGPVFDVLEDAAGVRPIARYPNRDVLLSGYARGESVVTGRAAAVEARIGNGRVVMFGFRPQHRAQTHGTFHALFNALHADPTADP